MTYKEKIQEISKVTNDYIESEMCVKVAFKCTELHCNNICDECWNKNFKEDK